MTRLLRLPPRTSRTLLVAGGVQLLAGFAPAARARVLGGVPFVRLPTAGLALAILAALTIAVAFRPRGWWRWVPGVLSGLVVAAVYWRLSRTPSGTFVDPVLRHAVHPAWGFLPMAGAVLLSLVGAALSTRAAGSSTHR